LIHHPCGPATVHKPGYEYADGYEKLIVPTGNPPDGSMFLLIDVQRALDVIPWTGCYIMTSHYNALLNEDPHAAWKELEKFMFKDYFTSLFMSGRFGEIVGFDIGSYMEKNLDYFRSATQKMQNSDG